MRREEESVYALAGAIGGSGSGNGGALKAAPHIAHHRAPTSGARVKMHTDSSQVESCINPIRGVRDAQRRAGRVPTDHARLNALAVKEASRLNALRRLAAEEDAQQHDTRPGARRPRRPATTPADFARGLGSGDCGSMMGPRLSAAASDGGGSSGGCSEGATAPRRDFVAENRVAAAAARRPPRAETRAGGVISSGVGVGGGSGGGGPVLGPSHGRVPAYLLARRTELAEAAAAREAARQAALLPPGMRVMPEAERLAALDLLRRNRAEVEAALAALSLTSDAPGTRRRRDELGRRLAEVDDALRLFGRKHVLVRAQ